MVKEDKMIYKRKETSASKDDRVTKKSVFIFGDFNTSLSTINRTQAPKNQ